ncbi:MAG: hypothetical protein E3J21_20660 [Anaerolineales bacterium]|nr:MAG: hypothetical protein E3J21_20660 [Anaerolineales bacterium]
MRGTTTFEGSWRNVTKVLKETFKLSDARIVWLSDVRDELRRLASVGIPTAPDFTLHNEIHSDNVVLLLDQLAKHLEPPLTEYESYLLVAAAYLHDVGMFFGAPRFKQEILSDLAGSLAFCEENICDSGAQYQAALVGKPVNLQIRAVHHLLSAYLISEEGNSIFRLYPTDRFHVIAICRGHRKANLRDQQCRCYETWQTKYGEVRRDLLAALLRLADALDFYQERAPEEIFRIRARNFLENPIALKHWLNHYFATSVYVTIGDRGGNPYLDCQLTDVVPARRTLNERSYKDFFTPLFDDFLAGARCTDFPIGQYPQVFREVLGIRDIQVNREVRAQRGAVTLPDKVVEEIERSGCTNILEFLDYLESREGRRPEAAPSVMDRYPEMRTFQGMLAGDDPQHRLMLMVGGHGQGKTWLMRTFESMATEQQVPCLKLDLRGDTIEFDDILDRIWRALGSHRFPLYSAQRGRGERLERQASEERRRELTECFFTDWEAIKETPRLVLLLDTYERAAPMLQDWIEKTFLEKLKCIEQVIVVIGGRKWSEINGYWQIHGYRFPLEGVQLHDYKEYAAQRGVKIAEADLVQLHSQMGGLPKLFVEYMDALVQVGV